MAKCSACGKFVSTAEVAKCSKCASIYDRACVALPASGRIVATWVCPLCTAKLPRDNNPDTPVKGIGVVVEDKAMTLVSESISEPQLNLAHEMKMLREEMIEVRAELAKVRSSLSTFKDRMDALELRIENVEQGHSSKESSDYPIAELAATVCRLQAELNDRDQELLSNDVELTNLPESKGENTVHVVTLVASKLGLELDEGDIVVSAVRVGSLRPTTMESQVGESNAQRDRPRAVVVRLARRSLRDEFLRNARVRRGATTSDLGLHHEPRRFYVNERLTRFNRQLFHKAREEVRRLGGKFVWTKDGRIYTRQEPGKPAKRVRTDTWY